MKTNLHHPTRHGFLLLEVLLALMVFGIAATRIDNRDDVEGGLAALLAEPGPALLHVAIDARANVWPLVPPNTANSTMLESNPAHARQETPNAIPA